MASKALYSEVIELVADITNFKDQILESYDKLEELRRFAREKKVPIIADASKYIVDIDEALRKTKQLREEIERSNKIIAQRQTAQTFGPLMGDIHDVNASRVTSVRPSIADTMAQRQLDLEAVESRKQAEYQAYKQELAQQQRLAQVKRAAASSALEQNREIHARAAANAQIELNREERLAQVKRNLIAGIVAQNREIHARAAANLEIERQTLAVEQRRLNTLKQSYGYKVGNFASGARVGAALDLAAGAGFALGGTNLGASIYMLERLSYATGVGQKNLGEFAQKLGLIKLEGEGSADSIARFGGILTKVFIGAGIVAGIAGIAAAGRELNRELAIMSTLLAPVGTSADVLSTMIDKTANAATRLSNSFNIDQAEVVRGFYDALSTGIDSTQLEKFGTVAATVARGLNVSMKEATSILTTLKDAYGASVDDMSKYADILFNAIDVGKFNVKDLQNNLGRVAVSAAEAGVSIEDMMGALAGMNRAGLSTSQSVTSLNRYITAIIKPTQQAAAMMDKLGIAYGSAAFKGRSLADQIEEIRAMTGGDIDLISKIMGTEQGRRGAVILTSLPALMRETREAINSTGSAAEAASRAMNTFGENVSKFFKVIWNSISQAGSDALNTLNIALFGSGSATDKLTTFKNVLDALLFAINAVIGVVGTAIVAVRTLFGTVYDGLKIIGLAAQGKFSEASDAIDQAATNMGNRLRDVQTIWTRLGTAFADRIVGAIDATSDAVTNLADKSANAVKEVPTVFTDSVLKMLDQVATKSDTVFGNIAASIRQARFEAEKLAFGNTYKSKIDLNNLPQAAAPNDNERKLLEAMQRGREIRAKYGPTAYDVISYGEDGGKAVRERIKRKMAEASALDPEDPDVRKVFDIIQENREKRAKIDGESLGKAEAEARLKAYKEHMRAAGFGKEVDQEIADKKEKKPNMAPAYSKSFEDFFKALDKLKETKPQDIDDDWLRKVRQSYEALFTWYNAEKSKMNEAERKGIEDMLKIAEKGLKDVTDARTKYITAEYKKQYDAYYKVWQDKMRLYEREIKKAEELRKKSEENIRSLKQYITELQQKSRNDPVFERRQKQIEIEERMRKVGGMTDSEAQSKEIMRIKDLVEEFRKLYEAEGHGRRAAAMAEEFARQLIAYEEANKAKQEKIIQDNITKGEQATTEMWKATADNPIAQAVRAEVMPVVKEALKLAATNGIGVAGDINSKIDINSIDVNLPVSALIGVIQKEVQRVLTQHYKNIERGRDPATIDPDPIGSPSTTGSGYSGMSPSEFGQSGVDLFAQSEATYF